MSAWQPIETAPKDGTRILAAHARGGVAFARWNSAHGGWLDDAAAAQHDYWNYVEPEEAFTHWQPLPEPPGAPQ